MSKMRWPDRTARDAGIGEVTVTHVAPVPFVPDPAALAGKVTNEINLPAWTRPETKRTRHAARFGSTPGPAKTSPPPAERPFVRFTSPFVEAHSPDSGRK